MQLTQVVHKKITNRSLIRKSPNPNFPFVAYNRAFRGGWHFTFAYHRRARHSHKKKLESDDSSFCTRGRDRTGTSVTSSVFETDASTYSATWASVFFEAAKIQLFLIVKLLSRNFFSCIFANSKWICPHFCNEFTISNLQKHA